MVDSYLSLDFLKGRLGKLFFYPNLLMVWVVWGLAVNFFPLVPDTVPLLYSQPWGSSQLVPTSFIFLFPVVSTLFIVVNLLFLGVFWRTRESALSLALVILATATQSAFVVSLVRILINVSESYRVTVWGQVFFAASLAFVVSYVLAPVVRTVAQKLGAVDDPDRHDHPAILHKEVVPRAGSVAFIIAFILVSFAVVPTTWRLIGIWIGAVVMGVVGFIDDRGASGKFVQMSPYVRLVAEFVAALIVVGFGVGVPFFRNPFGGMIRLDTLKITFDLFGSHQILILANLFAVFWIVWVMNMLSWSNGVDGQFSGIISLTCFFLGLISLQVANGNSMQIRTALLFSVAGGAALGLLPITWHPSKILWGFGATSCGLIIASLSILSTAKVATSILVLLVPTLDAVVAIFRRISRGASPVWGDMSHFHHHLLQLGLTQKQVAVFYWGLTFVCGLLALYTVQKGRFLTLLTAGGLVAFVLVVFNWGRHSVQNLLGQNEKSD